MPAGHERRKVEYCKGPAGVWAGGKQAGLLGALPTVGKHQRCELIVHCFRGLRRATDRARGAVFQMIAHELPG